MSGVYKEDKVSDFYEDMNASPWKGIITEVGLGLEFSAAFLRVPGASNTILDVNCPYDGAGTPDSVRRVSLENARHMARENLYLATDRPNLGDNAFGLAITGAHYDNRDSHVWIYLATPKWEAYLHFSIAGSGDREWIGNVLKGRVQWFMNACMLSNDTWAKHIEDIGDSLETHKLDVLYAPGVSDVERMLLLRPWNPLVYHNGMFHRVTDYLRKYDLVFPGTFNPPTKCHLLVDGLFEITQNHCFKGSIAIGDLLDRMHMLDLSGKATLITQASRFVDKYKLLVANGMENVTFHVGTDAWNALIAHHQYPSMEWMGEQMPNAKFVIRMRKGRELTENAVSNGLTWDCDEDFETPDSILQYSDHSSTEVRCAEAFPSNSTHSSPQRWQGTFAPGDCTAAHDAPHARVKGRHRRQDNDQHKL